MSKINYDQVKKLREETGAGFAACKEALQACENNFEKATDWLRKKSVAISAKKKGRQSSEGSVSSYIHGEGRVGVLTEVNCETDFVARSEEFKNFVQNLNLHITAMQPLFIKEEDIPADVIQREKDIFKEQASQKGKNPDMISQIATGLYNKWLGEVCLLHQEFVCPDQSGKKQTVLDHLNQLVSRCGENIVISRFVRFELGEGKSPRQSTEG